MTKKPAGDGGHVSLFFALFLPHIILSKNLSGCEITAFWTFNYSPSGQGPSIHRILFSIHKRGLEYISAFWTFQHFCFHFLTSTSLFIHLLARMSVRRSTAITGSTSIFTRSSGDRGRRVMRNTTISEGR